MDIAFIHDTAEVSPKVKIGKNTKIWHYTLIRENVRIGKNCIFGKGVYVDQGVQIGSNVKIQNNSNIYQGVTIENNVFIGPAVTLTNDKFPRSTTPEGILKTEKEWLISKSVVKKGASIGAGSIILPGVSIGDFALIGAGSIVTKSLPAHALALGNPARIIGFVCKCSQILTKIPIKPKILKCKDCLAKKR